MEIEKRTGVVVESIELQSEALDRLVKIDFYLPVNIEQPGEISLLLINDGQDLETMGFDHLLDTLLKREEIGPLLCVGIHCGEDRHDEYGMVSAQDHLGRGSKAPQYSQFIINELLPYIFSHYHTHSFKESAYAGFSLGALSAFDLVWNNPDLFSKVGVFSGALWWRSKDKDDKDYDQHTDRLMQSHVRNGEYQPGLKFFFQCGEKDESEDRNRNGVIDSIDDTIDLMRELLLKGYKEGKDMTYLQIADGRHDVSSWARALPEFLKWGWGKTRNQQRITKHIN